MESGSNKFDDLSGASEPAKFDRKTLIDSTPCTEQNVNVQSTGAIRNHERRNARLLNSYRNSQIDPTEADPEVRHAKRRKDPAFTPPT